MEGFTVFPHGRLSYVCGLRNGMALAVGGTKSKGTEEACGTTREGGEERPGGPGKRVWSGRALVRLRCTRMDGSSIIRLWLA